MEYEEYLEQGETLASEGLIEEALARFEQALDAAPENPEVIEAVGRALLHLDRLEEAEASFLDALELDPEWVAPRMGLAMVALRRDEPFKIVHHLERAIEADPEQPDAYVELGRYYGLMGEPALAKATFERWTKVHPEDADMLINAGLTAFDAADYAQAYAFFELAIEAASDAEQKSGARTFRANALDMLGRYAEAVTGYEEVIAETPDWWEAHANLGICHARNGHPDEAEAAFRRGLQACPGSPEIRDELAAHLLGERKDLQEALALAEEAVALGRDEIRHLHTLGEARLSLGDEAGAEEAYRAVLVLDPENPEAHLELGILHEHRGEVAEAEEHFVESLKATRRTPAPFTPTRASTTPPTTWRPRRSSWRGPWPPTRSTPRRSRRSPASGPGGATTQAPWPTSRRQWTQARATSSTSRAPSSSPRCAPTPASVPSSPG